MMPSEPSAGLKKTSLTIAFVGRGTQNQAELLEEYIKKLGMQLIYSKISTQKLWIKEGENE